MANRLTFTSTRPPPVMPAIKDMWLAQYFLTFTKWCVDNFDDRTPDTQALPFVLLQASDPPVGTTPKVFKVTVTTAGALVVTNVPLGSGLP